MSSGCFDTRVECTVLYQVERQPAVSGVTYATGHSTGASPEDGYDGRAKNTARRCPLYPLSSVSTDTRSELYSKCPGREFRAGHARMNLFEGDLPGR